MLDNILEIIRKNLPEQTAGVLKSHLEECDKVLKKNKELEETIKKRDEEIFSLKQELGKARAIEHREKEVTKKETELREKTYLLSRREDALEVELLKVKLEMATQSRNEIKDLANTVFRNSKLTYSEYNNGNRSVNGVNEYFNNSINRTMEEVKE